MADLPRSRKERRELIKRLSALPPSQFEMLIYALAPPPGIIEDRAAAQGNRASSLLQWVEGPHGPGLRELIEELNTIPEVPKVPEESRHIESPYSEIFAQYLLLKDKNPRELRRFIYVLESYINQCPKGRDVYKERALIHDMNQLLEQGRVNNSLPSPKKKGSPFAGYSGLIFLILIVLVIIFLL